MSYDPYTFMTPSEARQGYVEAAVEALRPLFDWHGKPVPNMLRVSVGFSYNARKHMGVCFHASASSDEHREIFIAPSISDTESILATLAHELCHAALPDGTAHKLPFKTLAYAIGLTGKATATVAGPGFKNWVKQFVETNGEYPGGSVNLHQKDKQPTAMLKVECPDCGYTARTTKKWLESSGAPICPCNHQVMEIC